MTRATYCIVTRRHRLSDGEYWTAERKSCPRRVAGETGSGRAMCRTHLDAYAALVREEYADLLWVLEQEAADG